MGLKKGDKEKLLRIAGSIAKLKIKVLEEYSSKAYNAHLIEIIEEIASTKDNKIEKKTVEKPSKPEKLEKKAQEPVKIINDKQEITSENVVQSRSKVGDENKLEKKPDDTQKQQKSQKETQEGNQKIVQKTPKEKPEEGDKKVAQQIPKRRRVFVGKIYIARNVYYILDVRNRVKYRLVSIKPQQIRLLTKFNGENIKVEINITSKIGDKLYQAELIRIFSK